MGTAIVSYYIQYSLIEEPRIIIEEKRSNIDALKAIEGIIPNLKVLCKTIAFHDRLDWRLECSIANIGAYGIEINLENSDVSLYRESDLEMQEHRPSAYQGFEVNDLNNYPASALVQAGGTNLIFKNISLDRKKYPNGIPRDISVKACIQPTVKKSLEAEYKRLFPEYKNYIVNQKPPKLCILATLD